MALSLLTFALKFKSDILKVWWLLASFIWGVLQLAFTLLLSDGGNNDWTFGQIVPVLLIAAPLISIFEFISKGMS